MPAFIDLTGRAFGKLSVLGFVRFNKRGGSSVWRCRCECGRTAEILGSSLRRGQYACGCVRRKQKGLSHTPAYRCWQAMMKRCTDSTRADYARYGGRGITICKEWLEFQNFLRDMGQPTQGMSLDRINNDLGYCQQNCRWATAQEQSQNRRDNVFVVLDGEWVCLTEAARRLGISASALRFRIIKRIKSKQYLGVDVRGIKADRPALAKRLKE